MLSRRSLLASIPFFGIFAKAKGEKPPVSLVEQGVSVNHCFANMKWDVAVKLETSEVKDGKSIWRAITWTSGKAWYDGTGVATEIRIYASFLSHVNNNSIVTATFHPYIWSPHEHYPKRNSVKVVRTICNPMQYVETGFTLMERVG